MSHLIFSHLHPPCRINEPSNNDKRRYEHLFSEEISLMITHFAPLGLGIITKFG